MSKYTLLLIFALSFIGCFEPSKYNTVTYKYQKCESYGDIGIKLVDGILVCVESNRKTKYRRLETNKRRPLSRKVCETTITQYYYSKSSGLIITCRGKLLEGNQRSKRITIRE